MEALLATVATVADPFRRLEKPPASREPEALAGLKEVEQDALRRPDPSRAGAAIRAPTGVLRGRPWLDCMPRACWRSKPT